MAAIRNSVYSRSAIFSASEEIMCDFITIKMGLGCELLELSEYLIDNGYEPKLAYGLLPGHIRFLDQKVFIPEPSISVSHRTHQI